MESVLTFFKEFLLPTLESLGWMLLKIVLIILLIMIVIEILKALGVLKWINKGVFFFTKYLGISKEASFPMLIGVFVGITYGAGAILLSYKNNEMSKKDVVLVSVFLCLCHAIFEDTLLFASLGSKTLLVIAIKLLVASIATATANLIIMKKEKKNQPVNEKYPI
ncbi:MAG: nucleoside recognition domain-containing protein [Bacilli bacterium]|jgi:hypothetical protein|nr:nucleoside recognition domain-containing protein [Bacilli bacterium]